MSKLKTFASVLTKANYLSDLIFVLSLVDDYVEWEVSDLDSFLLEGSTTLIHAMGNTCYGLVLMVMGLIWIMMG